MTNTEIFKKAIYTYGGTSQMLKAIEELAELQRALSRFISEDKGRCELPLDELNNVSEEMADVEIMLEQLKMMLGNRKEVAEWKTKKIARLAKRLKNE